MNPIQNQSTTLESCSGLNRRRFLRGLGAGVALPVFESILSSKIFASDLEPNARLAKTASGAPLRLGVVYFPNGAIQSTWWPTGEGTEFDLNRTMQPLA